MGKRREDIKGENARSEGRKETRYTKKNRKICKN